MRLDTLTRPFTRRAPNSPHEGGFKRFRRLSAGGLRQPIVLDGDGRLVDGRNRLAACKVAKVAPEFVSVNGADPVALVVSLNVKRRNLTGSQRAIAAAEAWDLVAGEKGKRARNLAPLFATNHDYVSKARALVERDLDAAAAVKTGAKSLDDAYREFRARDGEPFHPTASRAILRACGSVACMNDRPRSTRSVGGAIIRGPEYDAQAPWAGATLAVLGGRCAEGRPTVATKTKLPLDRLRDDGGDWEALADAFDRIERTRREIGLYAESYEEDAFSGTPPTLADIGLMWEYLEGLDSTAKAILCEVEKMRGLMPTLSEIRRELGDRQAVAS